MNLRSTLRARPAATLSFLVSLFTALGASRAATPSSGTVSATSGPVSVDFAPVAAGSVINVGIQDLCPPGACDNFDLTIALPAAAAVYYATNTVKVTIKYTWTSTVPTDLDVFAISPRGADHGPGAPDDTSTGAGEEDLTLTDPLDGVWHIRSVASLAPLPTAAHAVITFATAPRPTTPPAPPPGPGSATFVNYPAPDNITPALGSTTSGAHGAGEPSIGVNWSTGKTFIEAGNHTLRVTFNDSVQPATALWEDKRSPFARVSLDPILFTDDGHFGGPNRTFESQLEGATSSTSFTDDDAETWLPSQGSGQPAGVDHQTVGGGNYAAPAPLHTYPHAIYYCSQSIATAICARSDDGGVTFGPGIPIYTFVTVNGVDLPDKPGACGGLHGHIRVAPDGTAFVPNRNCQDALGKSRPGVAVSTDNGLTWTVRTVPDAETPAAGTGGDPSVAAGKNNTIYFGYANKDGHAKIATSTDRGLHWTKSKDAGTAFGIQNTEFAEVIAGDDNRAAFAFLGTTTAGDAQSADFTGVWHLYASFTYDAGRTWTTSDVTPSDPVQRGCIWNGGGSNPCRNLLDFNDITVDRTGRVLIGYADGCTGTCSHDPTQNATTGPATAQDALATIARQVGGRGLFSAFDGTSFGTGRPDGPGGGEVCSGDAASGITGGADCADHDDDD